MSVVARLTVVSLVDGDGAPRPLAATPTPPADPIGYTAAEVILLAAVDLRRAGREEFTEWDLTEAAWLRDKARFGMRGHADRYPDHKRVSMEMMGARRTNPLGRGWLVRVRMNVYAVTDRGVSEAARLRRMAPRARRPKSARSVHYSKECPLYAVVAPYAACPVFLGWLDRPETPENEADALRFLRGKTVAALTLELSEIARACVESGATLVTSAYGKRPIPFTRLGELLDFLTVLAARFPDAGDVHAAIPAP